MKPLLVRMTEVMVGKATYPYHDIDDNMDEWVKKAIQAEKHRSFKLFPFLMKRTMLVGNSQ